MDPAVWVKQNKGKAALAGGAALLFVMTRGHNSGQSANITSSDGTADGALADGEHVQLVPVSTAPAEYAGGNLDVPQPASGDNTDIPNLNNSSGIPYPIEVGGDINSPLAGQPSINGPEASGIIAATAAAISATRPAGHPGYTKPKPKKKPPKKKPHPKSIRPAAKPKPAPKKHPAAKPHTTPKPHPTSHPAAHPKAPAHHPAKPKAKHH